MRISWIIALNKLAGDGPVSESWCVECAFFLKRVFLWYASCHVSQVRICKLEIRIDRRSVRTGTHL